MRIGECKRLGLRRREEEYTRELAYDKKWLRSGGKDSRTG